MGISLLQYAATACCILLQDSLTLPYLAITCAKPGCKVCRSSDAVDISGHIVFKHLQADRWLWPRHSVRGCNEKQRVLIFGVRTLLAEHTWTGLSMPTWLSLTFLSGRQSQTDNYSLPIRPPRNVPGTFTQEHSQTNAWLLPRGWGWFWLGNHGLWPRVIWGCDWTLINYLSVPFFGWVGEAV